MMFLLQVSAPTSITIDTYVIAKLTVSFLVLSAILWGVKHLVRLISRS